MEISDDYKLFLLGAFSALQNISGKCIMIPNKSCFAMHFRGAIKLMVY